MFYKASAAEVIPAYSNLEGWSDADRSPSDLSCASPPPDLPSSLASSAAAVGLSSAFC